MSRAANKFAALVRGDDGALHVRRFATAADAAGVAAREREFVPAYPIHPEDVKPTTKGWPPSRLARELGISSRTICRRCERDQLPYINHGGASRPYRLIPLHVVKLVKLYGLASVARMRAAGQI
ncbi:hypothetical protein [Geminisphaera colitermitum]|uniref:hypothetical protein n=1 Tax=Geminisphaera colitermitum TaxID=1148786 RepID=UPI000158CCA9|nr:hypothetical protein [Geminisphaera colitermitum]